MIRSDVLRWAGAGVFLAALLAGGAPARAADAARGAQVFQACAACHADQPEAMGPTLKSVVGRASAAVPGYRYSGPMRRANLIWTEDNLREYIADPQAKVPGTRMPFGGLRDPGQIDDLLAYIKTL